MASRSDHPRYWHCAMVIRHGRVVGVGSNGNWQHAERSAINATPEPLRRGSLILSLRYGATGHLRLAKPCAECLTAIREAGIRRIRYSVSDGNFLDLRP